MNLRKELEDEISKLYNIIDEHIKINENLKHKVQYLTDCGIEKEEKYKEMLRKCSPLYLEDVCAFCIFCKQAIDQDYYGHTDDCEYLRLCGGAK